MSLYLKHRPQSFSEIIGNEDITTPLQAFIEQEDFPRVYLFSGPSGCGKTTLARIFLDSIGCHDSDLQEINSAENRGIDTVREIYQNCKFRPLHGDFRGYILDEFHQSLKPTQEALLKLLEDTPKHVVFIICTTDPAKLITALKNRCQQFTVKLLTDTQMYKLLRRVLKREQADLEQGVLEQIISDAQGSPRHALQILDQVLATPEEQRMEVAKQNTVIASQSIDLCRALISAASWGAVSKILEGLKGQEPEDIRRHVLGYCQAVLLKSNNPQAAQVIECFWEPFYNIGFPGLVLSCFKSIQK